MCRVLSYLGEAILAEDLIYKPNNSLVTQSYNPKLMTHMLNLAGFGFVAWQHDSVKPDLPYIYRTPNLPFYDRNLQNLSAKIFTTCMIAHVRGVPYVEKNVVSHENVHPFKFDNTEIAFAHNGNLVGFNSIKYDMLKYMKSEYRMRILGTTDSESMYALFLSQLPAKTSPYTIKEIFSALIDTLNILKKIRKQNGIAISSPLNFFISDGHWIVATRFVFDYGHYPLKEYLSPHMVYHSLWYTYGEKYGFYENDYQMKPSKKKKSIIIASEPLTEDVTTWIEVPEYSFIGSYVEKGEVVIESIDIT
jgi:glutamine amidotransferase